jgi:hypothetical protein
LPVKNTPYHSVWCIFYILELSIRTGPGLGRMSRLAVYCVWHSGSSVVRTPLKLLSAIPFGMVYFYTEDFLAGQDVLFFFLNKFSFYTKFGYNGYNLVSMMNRN